MENERSYSMGGTLGQRIRFFRNQAGMTQEDLANELNVTRQALSNWERDIHTPDLGLVKRMCFILGIRMDELVREVMDMASDEQIEQDVVKRRRFNQYDMAIGLFYAVGLFLGIGIFFVGGLVTMTNMGWAASLFGGGCCCLIFGLCAHGMITLKRPDR